MGDAPAVLKRARRVAIRALLAILGLGIVAILVRSAGPARVVHILWGARRWLPVLVGLELLQPTGDFVALRLLLGARRADVPGYTWLRSTAVAYSMMVLLPAGRGAGEVTRASLISKHVGVPLAAGAGVRLQAAYSLAIATFAAAEGALVATRFGFRSALAMALGVQAIVVSGLAAALLLTLRDGRLGRWLERASRRFGAAALSERLEVADAARARLPGAAMAVFCLARTAQVVEFGVVLRAVGGVPGAVNALLAHGIHLVGTAVGDLLPNQMGVVDGAFRAFASDVGFGDAPARALSIAFLVHVVQLVVASAGILIAALSRPRRVDGEPIPPTLAIL